MAVVGLTCLRETCKRTLTTDTCAFHQVTNLSSNSSSSHNTTIITITQTQIEETGSLRRSTLFPYRALGAIATWFPFYIAARTSCLFQSKTLLSTPATATCLRLAAPATAVAIIHPTPHNQLLLLSVRHKDTSRIIRSSTRPARISRRHHQRLRCHRNMMVEVNRTSGVEQTTKPIIDSVNFQIIVESVRKRKWERKSKIQELSICCSFHNGCTGVSSINTTKSWVLFSTVLTGVFIVPWYRELLVPLNFNVVWILFIY